MTTVLTRHAELEAGEVRVPAQRAVLVEAAAPAGVPPEGGLVLLDGETADIVDQWGMQSFPASDPPANW